MNFLALIFLLALTAFIAQAKSTSVSSRIGISFSPAGLLTPYHLGVSASLRENGLISKDTALAGSSGGSIVATTEALEMDTKTVLKACARVAIACRDRGTFRTLSSALNTELEALLPEDSADVLEKRRGKLTVAYQKVWPTMEAVNQRKFMSKADLMNAVQASCTIPMYFNGLPFSTLLDGTSRAIDGFFTTSRSRFGCPHTHSEYEIAVCPFDHISVGLTANTLVISPRLLMDRYGEADYHNHFYSTLQLAQLALSPPQKRDLRTAPGAGAGFCNDEEILSVYETLYGAGKRSTEIFLETNKVYNKNMVA